MNFDNDPTLKFVCEKCSLYPEVERAWLFGSRAKGQEKSTSDYDLAFQFNEIGRKSWGSFTNDLRENNPRLNSLDLVQYQLISDELRRKIQNEGIVIYEKT